MLMTWEITVFIAWGAPSFCLYLFVMHSLLFKAEFKSSFFKLATVMGFVDLANYTTFWFSYKLILYPPTATMYLNGQSCEQEFEEKSYCRPKNHNFGYVYLFWSMYFLNKVRELLLVSTAFNRFTAIIFPHQQQTIWEKFLWPIVCFCIIFPFLLTLNNLLGVADIMPFYMPENDGSYVFAVVPRWKFINNALLCAIHTFASSLTSLTFNFTSLVTLFIRTRAISNKTNIPKKAEINLLFVSCIDFGLDCIAVVHQAYMSGYTLTNNMYNPVFDQLYMLYPWIYDIINLSRPYVLLIMCKQMQTALFGFWKMNPSVGVMKLIAPTSTRGSVSVF